VDLIEWLYFGFVSFWVILALISLYFEEEEYDE